MVMLRTMAIVSFLLCVSSRVSIRLSGRSSVSRMRQFGHPARVPLLTSFRAILYETIAALLAAA
jgi:hypothetical protein